MSKDLTPTDDKQITKLNPKQELFCQLYASDREFFGNGTQAYIEAYGLTPKDYKTAMVNASKLLSSTKILKRINEMFEARGLNDAFVDKQLELLVTQNADLKTKLGALKEYNTLKKRVAAQGGGSGDTYNNFIQVNNLDPNKPESRDIVDMTLETLMAKTKRSNTNDDINGSNS